ncbi:related to 6-HYDROXY-D-NICOTINE OXIDASE [Phialocephala subalpina]|uniref:Related to 6-HYDROXY-D-NICOTINE OXIDASE n=1 Tax=Phialocephala subalpina TaxID=576137 RepID=A0A1L7X4G9_9HELO|nr:related to 6-HYDROXY-D-NICOTINE OXIDASE [Phialocephala subalpina]
MRLRFDVSALFLTFSHLTLALSPLQEPIISEAEADCHNACSALVNELGASVFYSPSSPPPQSFIDTLYTTQQRALVSACIITPTSPQEVSLAISIIRRHSCIFAVKSGGHSMCVGASIAEGGITIDLSKLDDVTVDEGWEWARVGTGNRWKRVYEVLELLGRTAVGGRNENVGVGGFILGGGISFVSRRYGWALDNVRNYEVVLANGTLTNINQASSPDLYWALRGGGNNFGIVTNFDLDIHPQGPVWGGQNFWLIDPASISSRYSRLNITLPSFTFSLSSIKNAALAGVTKLACKLGYCLTSQQAFRAFRDVVLAEQNDVYAQMWMSYCYVHQIDQFLFGAALVYSRPEEWPPVFQHYKQMKSLYSTAKIQNFTSVFKEVADMNQIGYRQMWAVIAFKMDEELLEKIFDIYVVEVQAVRHVKDVIPAMVLQPINKDEIAIFKKNGGNCLGMEDVDGPLILLSVTFRWSLAEDDEVMNAMGNTLIEKGVEMAKERGAYHPYIYMNYANATQDVFAGYGEENRARLREIQRRYDPEGVFSRLQPGYFKV